MVHRILTCVIAVMLAGTAAFAQEADVASVVIAPKTATLEVGESVTFTATAYDDIGDEIEADITWSLDGDIGVLYEDGLFVAETAGTGTVAASAGTTPVTADAEVTVEEPEPPVPASIVITPEDPDVEVGDTVEFTAVVYNEGENVLDTEVSWSVDGDIGTIDSDGIFLAETAGTGTVTATAGETTVTADVEVTVVEPEPVPASIVITPEDPDVEVGDTVEFTAVVYDEGENVLDTEVSWSVDGDIGTIDVDGIFVAENQGMGHVTAQAGEIQESVELHVRAAQGGNGPNPEDIQVYPANATVVVDDTAQFEVAVTGPDDEEIEDAEVSWSVLDETVGTVDENGLFTAVAVGETEVIATVGELSDNATVTVVEEIPEVDGPTITVKRRFPDETIKNFGAPIAVGDTLVLGGIPHPFNYLNGTHIFFPEGCIEEDILLMINIPEFGHVRGNSVEFDGDILTAVTFDVLVDGAVVDPFNFEVPVEVTLPYKYGLLRKMGIDPESLDMYYVGQNGQLYREGIEDTGMNEEAEGITAKVAHFSTLALASGDAPVEVVADAVPAGYALDANYPNPFNPETTISYSLAAVSNIRVEIYSVTGQHVRTLANGVKPAGNHSVVWDGTDDQGNRVTSGVYIYRLTAGEFTRSRKLMLMK